MGQKGFWKRLSEDINELSSLPLVELAGTGRLLIENHKGIADYSPEKICIKMGYGFLEISGNGLELAQITKDQLVVTGDITGLLLLRDGAV